MSTLTPQAAETTTEVPKDTVPAAPVVEKPVVAAAIPPSAKTKAKVGGEVVVDMSGILAILNSALAGDVTYGQSVAGDPTVGGAALSDTAVAILLGMLTGVLTAKQMAALETAAKANPDATAVRDVLAEAVKENKKLAEGIKELPAGPAEPAVSNGDGLRAAIKASVTDREITNDQLAALSEAAGKNLEVKPLLEGLIKGNDIIAEKMTAEKVAVSEPVVAQPASAATLAASDPSATHSASSASAAEVVQEATSGVQAPAVARLLAAKAQAASGRTGP